MHFMKIYHLNILFLFMLSLWITDAKKPEYAVKCAVCRSLIYELQLEHLKVDHKKKVETGSYRISKDGGLDVKTKKYADSELYMVELLESICKAFDDYAQARNKKTGKLEALKLIVDGKMNARFNEFDLVPDNELNKGLEYNCHSIATEYEDEITEFLKSNPDLKETEAQDKFCEDITGICHKADKTEL